VRLGHRRRDDIAAGTSDAHEIDLRFRDPAGPADQLGVLASRRPSDIRFSPDQSVIELDAIS
jgi:hypothetical protein